MVAAAWGHQLGPRDCFGPRRLWGMGRITGGPGDGRGGQSRRGGRAGMGWGWGALRQRREPGREEGMGGLPCGTLGAVAPWPGVADPGGGLEPGRAGQAWEAAL